MEMVDPCLLLVHFYWLCLKFWKGLNPNYFIHKPGWIFSGLVKFPMDWLSQKLASLAQHSMTPGETDEGKNICIVAMDVMVLDLFYIKGFITLFFCSMKEEYNEYWLNHDQFRTL